MVYLFWRMPYALLFIYRWWCICQTATVHLTIGYNYSLVGSNNGVCVGWGKCQWNRRNRIPVPANDYSREDYPFGNGLNISDSSAHITFICLFKCTWEGHATDSSLIAHRAPNGILPNLCFAICVVFHRVWISPIVIAYVLRVLF